ncbi:unnamed protein product [Symbiodinium pilosum]|uniref:Uncharacterized protein n=1 Tax=Symbiodinium pilosum TaxID=2952 RepID=A0A812IU97_SYMPI|nr:unnamed protein product [Symbiodinium pilosum]
MIWSFHSPSGAELPMYSSANAGWSLGKGHPDIQVAQGFSVRIFRTSSSRGCLDALGQEEYIPQEMLQGLLPDALLDRYKFWRSKEADGEVLVGEERATSDQPTELIVKPSNLLGPFEGALATVERRRLPGGHDPEFLVNSKSGMCGLTMVLARLENLSHILVWSRSVSEM